MESVNYNFFLVVTPGFEELALKELNFKFLLPGKIVHGGIEITCNIETGLSLNLNLKIPTRVLMRLEEFKCRDFPKLFKKFKKINFAQFLKPSYAFSISSSKSRLLNEKRILKTVIDSVGTSKVNQENNPNIYVRFYEDICIVSLDTTGEPLHKRGYKPLVSEAPLRETTASTLVFSLLGGDSWNYNLTLFDPMCGAGTFLLEAIFFNQSATRTFAFQRWNQKYNIQNVVSVGKPLVQSVVGNDLNSKTVKATESNLEAPSIKNLKIQTSVLNKDFFKFKDQDLFKNKNLVIITNPPYGKNIPLPKEPKIFYSDLINKISELKPIQFGVIIPKRFGKIKTPDKYVEQPTLEFENGGIPVVFKTFSKSPF